MASVKAKLHAHGCARCSRRLEDACVTPTIDPLCYTCRSGNPPAVWDANRLPIICCPTNSRVATPGDRAVYRLVGVRKWWLCRICKRTFPYHPEEKHG